MNSDLLREWLRVRAVFLDRLNEGMESSSPHFPGRSVWNPDGMGNGDITEFGDQMMNFEAVFGVPEEHLLDWNAVIRSMEKGEWQGHSGPVS